MSLIKSLGKGAGSPDGLGDTSEFLPSGAAFSDHVHQYEQEPVPLTFSNGYSAIAGYTPARCFKVGNFVQLQGIITGPAVAAGLTIFTVPVGFVPVRNPFRVSVPCRTNPYDAQNGKLLQVNSAGAASYTVAVGAMTYMSLFNVRWIYK